MILQIVAVALAVPPAVLSTIQIVEYIRQLLR